MAKKRIKGTTAADDKAMEAMAAEWLRSQGVKDLNAELEGMTQEKLDRLIKEAVAGNAEAVKDLRDFEKRGLIHVPAGSQVPVLGPEPKATLTPSALPKVEGKAARGKSAGKPLPEAVSDVGARKKAALDEADRIKAAKAAALEEAKKKKEKMPAVEGKTKVPTEAPKTRTVEEGPIIVPKPEIKAAKPSEATIGAKAAQEFRKRAEAKGVNADELLLLSNEGVKQLDQLPANKRTKDYMEKWLAEKAQEPAAKTRVKQAEGVAARLAKETPAERKARQRKGAQEAQARTRAAIALPSDAGEFTIEDLKKKNFAERSAEKLKDFRNQMAQRRIVASRVDMQKAEAVLALNDQLNKVKGGRPGTPLAIELEQAVTRMFSGGENFKANFNRIVGLHDRMFKNGMVRGGVVDIGRTAGVVKAQIAEENIAASGRQMGTALTPRELRKQKTALMRELKAVSGAKTLSELKQLIAEQGINIDARNANSQEKLFALLREEHVKKLRAYAAERRAEIGESATMARTGRRRKGGNTPEVEMPPIGGGAAPPASAPDAVEMPPIPDGAAEPEVAVPPATAKMPKARADKLRKVLSDNGLSEKGLLAAINKKAKGGPYNSIEELPEALDTRINAWINKAKKVRGAAPATATAAATGEAATKTAKAATAITPRPTPAPTPAPVPPAPAAAGAAAAEAGAAGAAGTAVGETAADVADKAGKWGKWGKLGASAGMLGRLLGPIAIAYTVYDVLNRLKGQSFDKADDQRLKVMQALGGIAGGMDQDTERNQMLAQQNTMVNLAGIQRQRDLDAMRNQYTMNREMNDLISGNRDLLASLSTPSQPSVAEILARM